MRIAGGSLLDPAGGGSRASSATRATAFDSVSPIPAREPRRIEVPGERGGEQHVAERVRLPGHIGVGDPRAHEDRAGMGEVVP